MLTFEPFLLWIMFLTLSIFSLRAIFKNRDFKTDKPYYIKSFNMFLVLKGIFLCGGLFFLALKNDFRFMFGGLIPFFLIRMIETLVYGMEEKRKNEQK